MNNFFIKIENFILNNYINRYSLELKDKILYLLENGKRLRPILFLIYTDIDVNNNTILIDTTTNNNTYEYALYNIAICIELIHSLSLVLDDLPEMDNDNMRRDKTSFHIKYGIEYTNFFIYYMFKNIGLELDTCFDILIHDSFLEKNRTKTAFEKSHETNISETNNYDDDINFKYTIINDINQIIKLNMNLLIDGQYNDLQWNSSNVIINTKPYEFLKEKDVIFELLNIDNDINNYITTIEHIDDIELNIELNIKKTSSLFNLSITSGYTLQLLINNINYSDNNEQYKIIFELLSIFSNILGYMFQISDDLLDIESDREKNKPNICAILDKDIVYKLLKNGCNWLYINAKCIHQLIKTAFKKRHDLENPARKTAFEKNNISDKDNNGTNKNKSITFNIYVINEIIKKIENRIK